ncbi:response regulator transcription factor [Microbacterium enclense]|uniref:response regulator transcription factor n=1 Tax=Microbacterium enclense TaxID=993073 RepID=UPI0027E359C3|nr:response regulator transcription factor [Microbacterium enclense]
MSDQPASSDVARVAIVDDDVLVRYALRYLIQPEPDIFVVAESSDGAGIMTIIDESACNVLLVDVNMRPLNGVAVAANVRRRYPEIRIVMMSSFYNDDFAKHALNAGADAFFTKTDAAAEIFRAIRGRSEALSGTTRTLSAREFAIAELASRGLTNDQIARHMHLSTNTVKTYLSRIFKKVGARNRVDLTNHVRALTDPSAPRSGQGVGVGLDAGEGSGVDVGADETESD